MTIKTAVVFACIHSIALFSIPNTVYSTYHIDATCTILKRDLSFAQRDLRTMARGLQHDLRSVEDPALQRQIVERANKEAEPLFAEVERLEKEIAEHCPEKPASPPGKVGDEVTL